MDQDDKQEKDILIEMEEPNTTKQTKTSTESTIQDEDEIKSSQNDRTINKTTPTSIEADTVKLDQDLFVLLFLLIYNNKYQNLSFGHKIKWWFSIVSVFIIQVFCLIVLSIAYIQQYINAGYDLWIGGTSSGSRVIAASSIYYINVCCVIVATMVLFSYLTKSISHSTKLFCACLHLAENKSVDKLLFKYGIIISTLNIFLIMSTWSISLIIVLYGIKFDLDNVIEIVFTAIGNVFILEIDDYFCDFFKNTFEFDPQTWSISVNQSRFKNSFWYHNLFVVTSLVIWTIIWSSVSEQFYRKLAYANDDFEGNGGSLECAYDAGLTVLLIQFSFLIYLRSFGLIGWKRFGAKQLSRIYLFACFMNIFQYLMISLVAQDGIGCNPGGNIGFAWSLCKETGFKNAGIFYCSILNPLMGVAVIIYILIVWSELIKESKLKQYSNTLFWLYQITSLSSLCIWRFKRPHLNEGWYAIGYGYGAAYIKYYGQKVF